jgi:pyruvate/2-oxoglutarate dehydrogenase complex dihydrolipoamide dehydrogenase (E3) component
MKFDYDVAIIGGGSAGYAAARTCAAGGKKTVVIEGGEEVGGLCILRGCMPTKALLYGAEVFHMVRHAQTFGVVGDVPSIHFPTLMARKDRLIKEFADYRAKQLTSGKFGFIRAHARFTDPRTVELSDGKRLTAEYFVVCTGSKVAPSPFESLDEVGYITSDEALKLNHLPKSLIVLGGGAVAVEFAQFFCRLGTRVTLIQRSPHILKEEEPEAGAVIEKVFRRENMTVFTDTHLKAAWKEGGLKGVSFAQNDQTIRVAAEEILYALGRIPNTRDLGLDKAGVVLDFDRFMTNSQMQSNIPHIFGAGDCTGMYEIVHIAIQQGEIAAYNILHPNNHRAIDYRSLISVIFTEPQVARVGLTEREAKQEKIPYLTASHPFNDHGKSMIMETLDGFVKLVANPQTGEILGGTCVGPMGGELIHEIVAAMHKRMTVHDLATMPHYHPTLAEIWTYPAEELAEAISKQS